MKISDPIGGAWLVARYGLTLVMPLPVLSGIGGRRSSKWGDGIATEIFVDSMRPSDSLRGHLTFHFKHETAHLELLARLFAAIDPHELNAWIADEPTGQYARRACFLFEFLTGRQLAVPANIGGAYIEVLDSQKLVTASAEHSVLNQRWRVRDNMPGTPSFCPMICKVPVAQQAMALDVPARLHELEREFGEDLLMRSAVWMTLRESKSSFAIEGEANQPDRIQRFADVLARRTGEGSLPLDQRSLADMQREILGGRTTLKEYGLRQSPVFVGELVRYEELVHYVAPPADDVRDMLDGLVIFLERTQGQSAVMRSAVAAFGFVYIHPLADGNGRVHRFLVNDMLRRDHALKAPMILPVSALIASDPFERRSYDRVLEKISRPLMESVGGLYEFSSTYTRYPDGVSSNFVFHGDAHARPVWRFPDLTAHVIYLAHVLERTLSEDMREESRYLRSHARARAAIKDIIEMPDVQIDCVIRSVEANQGKLSSVLAGEMPALKSPGIWDEIVGVVNAAFST